MSKKLSCTNCRKIKRKCDGNVPCSTCVRRKTNCEFSQEDRRHQRFSIGYVKSLETNIQFLEGMVAHLVEVREDPVALAAKLESLAISYHNSDQFATNPKIEPRKNDPNLAPIIASQNQYFGPGSIYHYRNPDEAPLIELQTEDYEDNEDTDFDSLHSVDRSPASEEYGLLELPITVEEDYEYVHSLIRGYFKDCYHGAALNLFDRDTVLSLLEKHDYSTQCLNKPLLYALCAMNETITHKESQQYFDLALKMLLHKQKFSLSLATSQAYTLLGFHAILKGESSRGWNLLGLGRVVGLDIGFDESNAQVGTLKAIYNRCYLATLLIEVYVALAVGRKTTMVRNGMPILQLPSESREDYLNIKYSVELVEFARHMLRTTYQPVQFHKDSGINYLVKFNRAKKYNLQVLKWKQDLDPMCDWLYKSMKSDDKLADKNHTLKVLFHYMILFLNKPFLHVPKKYSTVFLIEEMANELYLIVQLRLYKMQREKNITIPMVPKFNVHHEGELYCSSSMEICVIMALCHIIVTLIISQPDDYDHLGKHFRLFAVYLSFRTPRKYKAPINPIQILWEKYENFKNANSALQGCVDLKLDLPRKMDPPLSEDYVDPNISDLKAPSESESSDDFKISPRTLSDTDSRARADEPMELDLDAPSNFLRFLNSEKLADVFPGTSDGANFSNPYFQATTDVDPLIPNMDQIHMSYDQMAGFTDPLDQFFSNSGQEFEVPQPMVDWDYLFQNQYPNMTQGTM